MDPKRLCTSKSSYEATYQSDDFSSEEQEDCFKKGYATRIFLFYFYYLEEIVFKDCNFIKVFYHVWFMWIMCLHDLYVSRIFLLPFWWFQMGRGIPWRGTKYALYSCEGKFNHSNLNTFVFPFTTSLRDVFPLSKRGWGVRIYMLVGNVKVIQVVKFIDNKVLIT